jgi:hypothetical protein
MALPSTEPLIVYAAGRKTIRGKIRPMHRTLLTAVIVASLFVVPGGARAAQPYAELHRRGASLAGPVYDLAEGRRNISRAGAQSTRRGFPRGDCAREWDRPGPGLVGRYRLSSHANRPLRATRRQHRHGVAQLVRARRIECTSAQLANEAGFPDSVVGIGKIVAENSATGSVIFDLSSLLSDNIDLRNVINDDPAR